MKAATTAAKNTIQREHAVGVTPRVRAEWEYNRFRTPTVTVTPSQDGDDEWTAFFGNLDSIALPNRPRTGIAKARTGTDKVKPGSEYRDTPTSARFYPSTPDDLYVYWGSKDHSGLVNSGGYAFSTPVVITVVYDQAVAANKIVAAFETSYAKPQQYTIQTSANGTSGWTTIATNTAIGTDGRVTLWSDGSSWSTTPDYDSPVVIKGIRLTVTHMNTAFSHLDVLELGARLENDLTDFLVEYDVSMEASDRSFIAPLGRASSNTGSLSLSNIDGRFNNENVDSLYYGMIDKKVKFTMDLGIDATPQGGSKYEYIREFVMWADGWGGQDQSKVSVELKDSSVFLQEMAMPVVFLENCTVGAIIWLIMDRIGFTNYAYTRSALDNGQIIPFYWPKETETTVWEEFGNLAEATQTAIYFDENDVLQIRARKSMFDIERAVDWNLDATPNGSKLPDIVSTDVTHELEANYVDIKYSPANYADLGKNVPKMETAWEPEEDTVLLRGSTLAKDLLKAGPNLWINQAEAIFWPYEAMVNIRGEILSYKGKEYGYYLANGTLAKKVIYTLDEKTQLDALNETMAWKNAFTGLLKVNERNLYGSGTADHYVQPNAGYTDCVTRYNNSSFYNWTGGGRRLDPGYLRMWNNTSADPEFDIHLMKAASAIDETKTVAWYGTRVRIPAGRSETTFQGAGILVAGNDVDAGIYVEIKPTALIEAKGYREATHHELHVIDMPNNAGGFRPDPGLGFQVNILEDAWYDIDVKRTKRGGGGINIGVWLNGVFAGNWEIPAAQVPPDTGRFGLFVRGRNAIADFDYLYATPEIDNVLRDPDQTNWLDLRTGNYSSGFLQKEYKYNFRTVTPYYKYKKVVKAFPQRISDTTSFFDEFGPVVHEIREFDVKFADGVRPVGHSNLYLSNPLVEAIYYESDAFGARFMLANASRNNAVVKGEDEITLGTENPLTQVLFIYGRSVYQNEEKTLTKTDDASIRRRGPTKTEVASNFIQTDEMAEELGQWIMDLWASGVDEVTVKSFGNPFIQLGDLVTINYPVKGMTPATHKYFVVAVRNEFTEGYQTELVLRRARI